jgi:RNA polymerase sigma-70 factor, ECF subfamily
MHTRPATLSDLDARTRADACDTPLQMDDEAFRGFYERTARALWTYLYRLTDDRSAADDLLQESYYRLLSAATPFENETHRRRYLFRIGMNLVRDRSRRRHTRPVEVEPPSEAAAPESGADDRLAINEAISRLGPRERALIWLAYAEGASHEEIAGIVGVRLSSVKTLLFRARRRLAQLLGRTRRT